MKNKTTLLVLIIATTLFSSCGKEQSPETTGSRVKTYTEDVTDGTDRILMVFNMSYDGNNRITAITPTNSPGNDVTFTYQSNSEYTMNLITSGVVEISAHFFIRNSLLDSSIQFNGNESFSEKYYYDASNRLILKKEFESATGSLVTNTISFTYDGAGNMVKASDTNGNVDMYEYYTDLVYAIPAIVPFTQSNIKSALVKTHTVISYGNVLGSGVTTYTFDSHDRISTLNEVSTEGISSVKTYTYF